MRLFVKRRVIALSFILQIIYIQRLQKVFFVNFKDLYYNDGSKLRFADAQIG